MPEGKKLTPHLNALFETVETLNTSSNSINTILQAVEQQLIKANIGLEVWLESSAQHLSSSTSARDRDDCTRLTYTELGFTRLRDGWHIAARDFEVETDSHGNEGEHVLTREPYPIAQASRKERIEALQLLPDLIQALHAEATKAINTIEEAKKLIAC
jgi:hypothetical protein